MKRVNIHIEIGDLSLDFCSKVTIQSSWKSLTDTAKIYLPKKIIVEKNNVKKSIQDTIKRGDKVIVKAGYDKTLTTEFIGYVSSFTTGLPLVIECEDSMWKLKQTSNINKSWRKLGLQELVDFVAPDFKNVVNDRNIGAFRISDVNASTVLNELKGLGIKSYFRNEILHVGFATPLIDYNTVKYHFQKNTVEGKNRLKYHSKDDQKIRLKATSIAPDNSRETIEIGDKEGALRTLTFFNLTKEELKSEAEESLDDLKFTGLSGTFEAYGDPFISHGDIAELQDDLYPEHNASYDVDSVTTTVGVTTGYRRVIELGKLAKR